jgi:ribosomal protein S18 acetylase RimI-like enzyme
MRELLSIRAARATDLAAFFTYLDEHLRDNGSGGTALFQPMARADSGLPPAKRDLFITGMATDVGQPFWRRLWLAFDGAGAIAGHADLRARPEPATGHRTVLGMGVHREARRQGLGLQLIAAAEAWARAEGFAWLDLEVLSVNAAARGLYARAGFATVGEMADMFRLDGEQLAYVYMTKRL